jgi:CHAT domain-containing protein/Tfp pilus assembly protein PilF
MSAALWPILAAIVGAGVGTIAYRVQQIVAFRRAFVNVGFLEGRTSLWTVRTILAATSDSPSHAPPEQELALRQRLASTDVCLYHKGDYQLGLQLAFQGRAYARHHNSEWWNATFCLRVASAYNYLGSYEDAIECDLQARAVFERIGDLRSCAKVILHLGQCQIGTGDYDAALESFERALTLRKQLKSIEEVPTILFDIGIVYFNRGQFDSALAYYQHALILHKLYGTPYSVALIVSSIGSVYYSMGHHAKARRHLLEALHVLRGLPNTRDLAFACMNLCLVDTALQRYPEAEKCGTRALKMLHEIGNRRLIAWAHSGLGKMYLNVGNYELAQRHLATALRIRNRLNNLQDIVIGLSFCAGLYVARGRLDCARRVLEKAIRYHDQLCEQIPSPSHIGAFQEAHQGNLHPQYAHVLFLQERYEDALLALERGRGKGLIRQIAISGIDTSRIMSSDDASTLDNAAKELGVAQTRLWKEQGKSNGQNPVLSEANRRFEDADRSYKLLRDVLYVRYPAYRTLRESQPVTATQLKEIARSFPDSLYLQWAVIDERTTILFALSERMGIRHFEIGIGKSELRARVVAWREYIMRGVDQIDQEAIKLYQYLFGPLEKTGALQPGSYARLVLVADDPLLDLPFAALVDADHRHLVDRYALSYSISFALSTPLENRRPAVRTFLGIADPIDHSLHPSRRQTGFDGLKHAQSECKVLGSEFIDSCILTGAEAMIGRLRREIDKFAILHFATHSVLDPQDGLRSWLLLADGQRLEGREIAGMSLPAKMVVLSACETGRGSVSGGEGLLGLVWAFRAAGCKSVVASHWSVNDEATATLMLLFYKNLKKGSRKDDALRDAMVGSRRQYADCRSWAGFQVFGDAGPLAADFP